MASSKPGADAGTRTPARSQNKPPADHDGQCWFPYNGKRCPLPGNDSPRPGRGGPFYCLWHRHAENRKPGIAQDHHFETFADPQCVRAFIEITYQGLRPQDDIADMVAKHPEWKRESTETKSAYGARMRSLHHTLLATRTLDAEEADAT